MSTTLERPDLDSLETHTKLPFLCRVRIEGYKSIALCDVPLHPLTLLVGRNGAGKSNFLDALAFLRDVIETSATEAVRRRGGWPAVACRTTPAPKIAFGIDVGFPASTPSPGVAGNGCPCTAASTDGTPAPPGTSLAARYSLELTSGASCAPVISRESLALSVGAAPAVGFEVENGVVQRWRATPDSDTPPPTSRPDRPVLGVLGMQPFLALADGLRAMAFYSFSPTEIRQPQTPNPGGLLEPSGRNLAGVLATLEEVDPDTLSRLRDYLSLITEEVIDPGASLELHAFSASDGTLRALAALVATFQAQLPAGPSVVGIEEPETSLHPAAARTVLGALSEATGRTQVLLSTHSPDLLDGRDIDAGSVLVARNRRGRTQIAPVDPASREILGKGLYSLGDLQRMGQLEPDETNLARQAGSPAWCVRRCASLLSSRARRGRGDPASAGTHLV